MFSWRAKKQLVVFLILFVPVFVLALWFGSGFLAEPTCFDNKKNQGEFGIDCGGPCAPCELKNPEKIKIFWARFLPARPGSYDAAAEIENPNELLSSEAVEYEFSLLDKFGEISKKTGKTFILPQERTFVIESGIEAGREPEEIEFRIKNAVWRYKEVERPNVVVEKKEYRVLEEGGGKRSVMEASVANRSPFSYRNAEAGFLIFDRSGNVSGINKILIEKLLSGEKKEIKSVWPEELKGEIADLKISLRINVFEPDAIIKPYK